MAINYTQPIPVTTVADNSYPRPKLNADGQWVVSASAINQQANMIVMYDPISMVTYPVTPYTVSSDYYKQVQEQEATLAKIQAQADAQQQGLSNSYDPNEVNSFADVITAGNSKFKPIENLFKAGADIFAGHPLRAAEDLFNATGIPTLADKISAGADLIENTIIDPITAEVKLHELDPNRKLSTSIGQVGLKYLQNSLTNLGETMDMVTQANAVKGFIQGLSDGGIEQANANVLAANGDVYSKTGRKQFDWNVKPTGNAIIDTTANILLEVISDPTSWITFGAPSIMKTVGRKAIGDVLINSAKDVGVDIAEHEVDDLVKAALHTYIYKDTSLFNALSTSKFSKDLMTTPEISTMFFDAVKQNLALTKETHTLELLKSVRGASDIVQSAAMKATGISSALGLGYYAVKAVNKSAKVGIEGLSYAVAKMNEIFKEVPLDTMTLKNMPEVMEQTRIKLTNMKNLLGLSDEFPDEVIRRASASFQEDRYTELQRIVNKNQLTAETYRELNDWAMTQEYSSIDELIENLHNRSNVVPEYLASTVQELQNDINKIIRDAKAETITQISNQIRHFYKNGFGNNNIVEAIRKSFQVLYGIPQVTATISLPLLNKVEKIIDRMYTLNRAMHLRELYPKMNKFGTLTDVTDFFEYRIVSMPEHSYEEYYKDFTEGVTDPKLLKRAERWAKKAAKQNAQDVRVTGEIDSGMNLVKAEHLQYVLDKAGEFLDDIGKEHIALLKQTLQMWEDSYDDLTVEIMHNANVLWTELRQKINTVAAIYMKLNVPNIMIELKAQGADLKSLYAQLQKTAKLLKIEEPSFTPIKTFASDIVSKSVKDIPKALAKGLKQQGYDTKTLSELILRMANVDLTKVIPAKETDGALSTFFDVIDMLEDLPDMPYFVKEMGLDDLTDQWGKGFTIELGNEIIQHMDDIVARLRPEDSVRYEVQAFRDQVQDLIDGAYKNVETRIKTTTDLVTSKLYKIKLSHIQSVIQLLTAEGVEESFESIRRNFGIGNFLDALIDMDKPNFAVDAVSELQSLSKSIYVARRILDRIHDADFSDEWKNGIYDTLAGMARGSERRSVIYDVANFTTEVLSRAKKFIDSKNNAHLSRLFDLSKTGDTLEQAENLYKHIFQDVEETQEDTDYWKPLYKALNNDESMFNIVYSAAQTAKNSGQIYQFAFVLPDGSSHLFINRPVYDGMLDNLDDTTARELFGVDAAKAKENMRNAKTHKANVVQYDNSEDFAKAIYDMFQNAKQICREQELTPRLIGYNNGLDALGTDKALSDFTYKNLLNTKIMYDNSLFKGPLAIETVDAAEFMRMYYDGASIITEDMQEEVAEIFSDVKDYLDRANAGEPFSKAYIMPDFNSKVTAALRELSAVVDNTLHLNSLRAKGEELADVDYVNITKDQYNVLSTAFTNGELSAFKQELNSLSQSIGDTLLSIKQSNQVLGQTLLIQDALKKYLHEPNIMQILTKYLVKDDGVPSLSFKLFNDPKVFNTWFDKIPEDMTTLGRMYDIAQHLQDQIPRIKHPELLMDIDYREIVAVSEFLKERFIGLPNRRYSVWNAMLPNLKPDTGKQFHNYLVAKQFWDSIRKIGKPEYVNKVEEDLRAAFPESALPEYIFGADHNVMYNKPLYDPGVKVLQSELIDADNEIFQKLSEIETITHNAKQMETLEDALTLDQHLRERYGYSLSTVHIKEHLTKKYGAFVGSIKFILNDALDKFNETAQLLGSKEARFIARTEYSNAVKGVMDILDRLKTHHAMRRANILLTLPAEDYAKFLYKYSQGIQIIDLGSKIFKNKDIEPVLQQFMASLKDAEQYGIKYVMDEDEDYLYVYLDKELANLEWFEKNTKHFKLPEQTHDAIENTTIPHSFAELEKLLDAQTNNVYSVSMHRTMNMERYKELFEFLPADVSDNLIMKEYFNEKDLLDTYSQSILGDYDSGVGKVFSMYSGNIVTNVAAGFNSVYNNLRGKELYKTLFFNSEYKLSSWVDAVSRFGKVTYYELSKAIDNKGMVVCNWSEDKGVYLVPIKTEAQYRKAIDTGAMLLDYQSYSRAVEVLNDNKINSKMLNTLNRNFLTPLKVGQLLSLGWMLRNIPDSTIKGWTQAGLDPMYMTSLFTRTRHIIADYQYTYRKAFDYTKASLTPDKVAEFFKEQGTDSHLLSEDLFKKLLTFYNTTSSVATPAQLNLYNNLAHKLYLKVEGFPGIKESNVEEAIAIFTEHPSFVESKNILFERYPEDIATELLLLKKFMPESAEYKEAWASKIIDGIYPVKKLMEVNTDFEMQIRTHTFLYHTEYTNGTVSDALKMVDKSQFNRARDTKAEKILEMLLPFSSFQMDNFFFWSEQAMKGNVVAIIDDVLQGAYNEEELDNEELSRNMSLQYLFLSGNLVLDYSTGLVLKTNDSIHNVLSMVTNPIDTFANMFNVPVQVAIDTIKMIAAEGSDAEYEKYMQEHDGKTPYGATKPIGQYSTTNMWDLYAQLIPVVGVVYQRYNNALHKGKLEPSDLIFPLLMPSVFSVAKLDSAGTTYQSRPIGTDWYNRDKKYKDTHRYVFGVSYVPSWMSKNPWTYANTFDRLQQMGYSKETAIFMMQNGWYMKAPDYILKHYEPYDATKGKRPYVRYAKRYYTPRPHTLRTYPKYNRTPKKQKKFVKFKTNNRYYPYSMDRSKITRGQRVRRVYRPLNYSNRYTRTGVSRELMINWRGPNRSSRQLLRDRSKASRSRIKMQLRQIKPS